MYYTTLLTRNHASKNQVEQNVYKVLKEGKKQHKSRVLYAVKLSFRREGEIKMSLDKNWGNLSPVDLPCKKWEQKYFKEKEKWYKTETQI